MSRNILTILLFVGCITTFVPMSAHSLTIPSMRKLGTRAFRRRTFSTLQFGKTSFSTPRYPVVGIRHGITLYFSSSSLPKNPTNKNQSSLLEHVPTPTSTQTQIEHDTDPAAVEELDWETFEFGDNPKQDSRFSDTSSIIQHADDATFEKIVQQEIHEDEQLQQQLEEHNAALLALDPKMVEQATEIIQEYVTEERIERLEEVLKQRTQNCRFLFENPGNPSNVWACLRTVDSFGIQNVDIVVDSSIYTKKAAIAQKHSTRTAMGSAKWMTLHSHSSTKSALQSLKEQGYKIYASDLNPNSKDVRTLDWGQTAENANAKVCIVMGNEDRGISQEMRDGADGTFTLPMVGFAESFNLSVATAITLAHLSAKGKDGPIRAGDLGEHEVNCLRLKWLMNSLAQKRMGKALLRKHNIELPPIFDKF